MESEYRHPQRVRSDRGRLGQRVHGHVGRPRRDRRPLGARPRVHARRAVADQRPQLRRSRVQQLLRLDPREPRQLHAAPARRSTASDVHCSEMLDNSPHLYLGSTRDRYCNWQFMEFLKDKYCYTARSTRSGLARHAEQRSLHQHRDDPRLDVEPAQRLLRRVGDAQRDLGLPEPARHQRRQPRRHLPLEIRRHHRHARSPSAACASRGSIRSTRRAGDDASSPYCSRRRSAGATTSFASIPTRARRRSPSPSAASSRRRPTRTGAGASWPPTRPSPTPRYSALQRGADGELNFCVNSGEALFLVVMGTPVGAAAHRVGSGLPVHLPLSRTWCSCDARWPEGFQNGRARACTDGHAAARNGGGCAPSGAAGARSFVGPYAAVLGGTVSGDGAHRGSRHRRERHGVGRHRGSAQHRSATSA